MKQMIKLKKIEAGRFILKDGKLYFSKEMERKICFFMTMAMLLAGIFVKLGIF